MGAAFTAAGFGRAAGHVKAVLEIAQFTVRAFEIA